MIGREVASLQLTFHLKVVVFRPHLNLGKTVQLQTLSFFLSFFARSFFLSFFARGVRISRAWTLWRARDHYYYSGFGGLVCLSLEPGGLGELETIIIIVGLLLQCVYLSSLDALEHQF